MSKPVEATRPGRVTLPPSWPVRTRGGSTSSRSSQHLLGCSSATTPVITGPLGLMSQDLGLNPYTEGYVTSTLLIGSAIGAVLCGRINVALTGRLAMATAAHRFDLPWSPGTAAGDFPT